MQITVKDPKDTAVGGVKVVLSAEGKEDVTATTDADGVAKFENVAAGEYTVSITEGIPEGCRTPS